MDSTQELMIERRLAHYAERTYAAEQRAEVAEAELAAMKTPCLWVRSAYSGWLSSSCDPSLLSRWEGIFDFCPHCGHPVQVAE